MKLLPRLVEKPPEAILDPAQELALLREGQILWESEFGCTVSVVRAQDSQEAKAKQALPGKPAFVIHA